MFKGSVASAKAMGVNYEEAGEGMPCTIVMVHGAGGSSATWFMQLKGLSKCFHVVAIDLNGHGRTSDRKHEDIAGSYFQDIENVFIPSVIESPLKIFHIFIHYECTTNVTLIK